MTGQLVTANRLRDGDVVYLAPGGRWTLSLDEASLAETQAALEDLLKIAQAAETACEVISVYAMPAGQGLTPDGQSPDGQTLDPLSTRERIRATGPTTRTDLGKQANPDLAKRA